jgi:hypothetical protein
MQTINATTGHSPKKERKVAGVLYIAIAIAVIAGLAMFFILGRNKAALNPYQSDSVNAVAPDVVPGDTQKPGTVPDPNANPSDQNKPNEPVSPPQ